MKNLIKIITALAVMIGSALLVAPPANAGSNDFEFEVIGTSTGAASAKTVVKNTQYAKINGATQVLWQDPNFSVSLTPRGVRSAWKNRIKVNAPGANSSQVIYRKSGHARRVILMSDSVVRNTGRHNRLRVGFVQKFKTPVVVDYDKKAKQYRHVASLLTKSQVLTLQKTAKEGRQYKVVGKVKVGRVVYSIVIWCGNFIGGNVVMFPSVTQVRFEDDLLIEADASSEAKAEVTFVFKITCPETGANFTAEGFAWAYGSASSKVTYTQRTRAKALGSLELKARQNIRINQHTTADAQASIKVTGSCGDAPPPADEKPDVHVSAIACVNPGQTRDVTVTVSNPNDKADTARLSYRGEVYTKPIGANSQVTFTIPNQGAGSYTGTALLVNVSKSASFTVTVENCPPQTDNPPEMTCTGMEHIYVGEDRSAFDFDASDSDGHRISFGEPVVTGPLNVVTTERSGNRLTVWITAKQIPEGTSQSASVRLTANANGKSVSCTINTTVTNEDTGWE